METTIDVRGRLLALQQMSMPELQKEWELLFHHTPPGYGEQFMRRRLGYRIQELVYGGLDKQTQERIAEVNTKISRKETHLRQGTVIVREWHEKRHEVRVLQNGYEYNGGIYASLSAVARAITGVNRNGRQFFGLKEKA